MTKKELIFAQIQAEKLWLRILLDNSRSDSDLGLPKYITRRQAIDDSLDRIIKFRNQLKQLDYE